MISKSDDPPNVNVEVDGTGISNRFVLLERLTLDMPQFILYHGLVLLAEAQKLKNKGLIVSPAGCEFVKITAQLFNTQTIIEV